MKPDIQCVRTHWIRGFITFPEGAAHWIRGFITFPEGRPGVKPSRLLA
jgi:hypothetical protein